jgi:hypothetical protein
MPPDIPTGVVVADDILGVAIDVARALDDCGVAYSVGGSLASSFSGEPRFTLDIDIVVGLNPAQVDALVARLGPAYYADADAIARAVRNRSSVNLIHLQTNIKVDLFVVGDDEPSAMQLLRHQPRQLTDDPLSVVYFHSHEDIVLQKLKWFRAGGEVSERQWRDVLAIAAVRGRTLDRDYLVRQAAIMGVTDLLDRLWSDSGLA